MKRIGVVILVLAALGLLVAPRGTEAQTPDLLYMAANVTYDARLNDGPLAVTWDVTLDNNDPATTFNDVGVSYFYTSYTVPVLRGASSFGATSSNGAVLTVSTLDEGTGPIIGAQVSFESGLFYGESYSFSLSYEVPSVRSESLIITPFYAFFPALGGGNDSTVRVLLPDDPAWESTTQTLECDPTAADQYHCGAETASLPLAALVEVSRPDAMETVRASVPLQEQPLDVSVRLFPGEDAWATHALDVARAGLPVLEGIFGAAYPQESALEITERGQLDLLGYEGIFFCPRSPCSIGLSPLSNDLTTLHELAHAWTTNVDNRWIAEGLAEFMALRAAAQLGDLISRGDELPRRLRPTFPLDNWERTILPLDASEAQKERELVGYGQSVRFIEILEERFGLESLQKAHLEFSESSQIDSEDYLDALEDATGQRLDALFLEWVFPASFKARLDERRETLDMFALVSALAEQSDVELTVKIDELIDNWRFELAQDELLEAGDALAAYNDAKEDVEGSRDLLQRIGMVGEDPDSPLEDARAAIEVGRYSEAEDRAEDAQETVGGATMSGLVRLLIVLALPLALLAIVLVATWQRRRATRPDSITSI